MKNLTKIGILTLLIALTFSSCKKVVDKKIVNANGEALGELVWKKQQDAAQDFSINVTATTNEEITSEQGMKITFNANSFKDEDGNIITGNIDIELIEIFSKVDMLLMNKSTMGKLPNGDHAMMRSGGEFRLSAEKDGEPLALNNPVFIKVPVDNTGGEQSDMKLFSLNDCDGDESDADRKPRVKGKPYHNGCPTMNDEVVWEEVEADSITPAGQGGLFVEDFQSVTYYAGFVDNFGWTNVDKFISYTGEKTTLKVKAPEGYDHTNIAIYISYEGEANGLATLDTYLEDEGVFSEHYGQIPVGKEINVIAVSIVDDQYSSTIKPATIEENGIIILDDLVATTEAVLTTQINNLP